VVHPISRFVKLSQSDTDKSAGHFRVSSDKILKKGGNYKRMCEF
jgi:hypothetical protein